MNDKGENEWQERVLRVVSDTSVRVIPEEDGNGAWVHSDGMLRGHKLPEIEIRHVPMMFIGHAMHLVNQLNAKQLQTKETEGLIPPAEGETLVGWTPHALVVKKGDTWEGVPMIRIESSVDPTALADGCMDCNHPEHV